MSENATKAKGTRNSNDDSVSKLRVLAIYDKLLQNKPIAKEELAEEFHVNVRTIQRDIKVINEFLQQKSDTTNPDAERIEQELEKETSIWEDDEDEYEEELPTYAVKCREGMYRLNHPLQRFLTDSEAFAVIKMLLDCRGLNSKEMDRLKNKIIECCIETKDQLAFKGIIARESKGYKGPQHGKDLIDKVWALQKAMRDRHIIKVQYTNLKGGVAEHKLIPVGVIYNEFYFYLVAYSKKTEKSGEAGAQKLPRVYRIDRIASFEVLHSRFTNADVPVAKQCTEAEFRQRVQFMYIDELMRATFTCRNFAVEAIMDRLPSAEIIKRDAETTTITALVYGTTGMEMWLAAQGDNILEKKYVKSLSTVF